MATAPKHERQDHREVRQALGDLDGLLGDFAEPKAPAPHRPKTEPAPEFARVPPAPPGEARPVHVVADVVTPPKPEAKTEPRSWFEPKTEPTAGVEAKTEPKPEAKTEPKSEAKTQPKPAAKAEPKPAAKAEPKPAAKAEPPARRAALDDPLAPVFAELASLRLEIERLKAREEGQGLEGWRFAVLLVLGLILLAAVVIQIIKA